VHGRARKPHDGTTVPGVGQAVVVGVQMREDDVVDVGRFQAEPLEPVEHVAVRLADGVGIARQVAEEAVPPEHVVDVLQAHRPQVDEHPPAGPAVGQKRVDGERDSFVVAVRIAEHVVLAEQAFAGVERNEPKGPRPTGRGRQRLGPGRFRRCYRRQCPREELPP